MYRQMRSYSDNLVWATIIPGGLALDQHVKGKVDNIYLAAGQKAWNENVFRYNVTARKMYEDKGVLCILRS